MEQASSTFRNGEVSYWFRDAPRGAGRAPLSGDLDADVAIAGAGLTGLWVAYYLAKANPALSIVVLDKEFPGYGASGRNGGWLSAEPPGQLPRYAAESGWPAAVALQRAMFGSIDEVARILVEEGIDADLLKDGAMYVATTPAQLARLHAQVGELRKEGWAEGDIRVLSVQEVGNEVAVAGALGGTWTPHCARIQPAKLVTGLAQAVERLGVRIYERTEVTRLARRQLVTSRGVVRARVVVNALEGYQARLPGLRRRVLPMNSSMIVTEPLSSDVWEQIGWRDGRLLADHAHSYVYIQRTRDGRIAIGGRGVPYRFASTFEPNGSTARGTVRQLKSHLGDLFPPTRDAAVSHAWSGILGVPRDWTASVTFDRSSGVASCGGYTGNGVTSTNLAARTLVDLIQGRDTELTRLPWVGRRSRDWEPEPLRWVGARSLYVAYRHADRQENARPSSRTSWVAQVADRISGRH